jgi:acetyltransferase-like isoleucine patch superfamily enzyme
MHNLLLVFFRRLFSRPPATAQSGAGVYIRRPRVIEGPENMIFGENVIIAPNAWIATYPKYYRHVYSPSLIVGARTQIGRYCCITCINSIKIGEDCLFSEYIYISDHTHGFVPHVEILARQALHSKGPVVIGDSCFIGYRAVVLPGVTLGRNCVVGANSVVTRSFPDYSMVVGVPARLIKKFSLSENKWVDT